MTTRLADYVKSASRIVRMVSAIEPDDVPAVRVNMPLISELLENETSPSMRATQRLFWERFVPRRLLLRWLDSSELSGSEAYDLAWQLIVDGEYARAERLLRERLDRSSTAGHSSYALGVLLVAMGRYAEARATIERAIRVRPWTRDFPTDQLDLLPRLDEMAGEHGDWEWLRFQRQRHRFASVALSINNAVSELLSDDDVVVQVGANDGRRADPIYKLIRSKPALRGVLVEPMPQAFRALVSNSHDIASRFAFENAAIGVDNGVANIYYDPNRPTTLSSMRPDQTMLGENRSGLKCVEVRMMTLSSLFEKHEIDRIGLFQSDTEGFDWVVLKQLELDRLRPAVINCEHYSLTWEDRVEMCEHLYAHGYAWRFGVMDMIAIDRRRFGPKFAFCERW